MTNGTTVCGKCGGSGEYHFRFPARVEACYPCEGTGRVVATKAAPALAFVPQTLARRTERARLDLRAMYRNIDAMGLTYADATDGRVFSPEHFEIMLSLVPAARAAFQAKGWPV